MSVEFIKKDALTYEEELSTLNIDADKDLIAKLTTEKNKFDDIFVLIPFKEEFNDKPFELDLSRYNIETTKRVLKRVLRRWPFGYPGLKDGIVYYNSKQDLDKFIAINQYIAQEYKERKPILRGPILKDVSTDYCEAPKLYDVDKIATPKKRESVRKKYQVEGKSFSETLFKFIDDKGLEDTQVYTDSNIDRKLFSKIRIDNQYNPRKTTVLALCIGLKLNLMEAKELLETAGYSLSKSKLTDVIVESYIINKEYDIDQINEELYEEKLPLLGSVSK